MNERHQGRSHYENDDYRSRTQQSYPSHQRGSRGSQDWSDEDRVPREVQAGQRSRGSSQPYPEDEMYAGGRDYGQRGYEEHDRLRQRGNASQQDFGGRSVYGPGQDPIQGSYLPPDRARGGQSLGPAYGTDMNDPNRFGQDSHGMYQGFARGLDEGEFGSQDYDRSSGRAVGYGGQRSIGQQDHRGRGPKNYMRSDERIREDLSERLSEDAAIDASEIEVHVKDGIVRLTGTVSSRWMKHRAEDMADRCSGVKDIDNQLRVSKQSEDTAHRDSDHAGNEQGKSSTASSQASRANH